MKKIIKNKEGFTLIEMLVAMAIFVMFMTVLINTYTYIVRQQQATNEKRALYVEARKVFDALGNELRDGMVDYLADKDSVPDCKVPSASGSSKSEVLCLVSKDDSTRRRISVEGERVKIESRFRDSVSGVFGSDKEAFLHSEEVKVKTLDFYIYPLIDPYDLEHATYDTAQFQPMVTVYAEFYLEEFPDDLLKLQTTISSRIYNQVYAKSTP